MQKDEKFCRPIIQCKGNDKNFVQKLWKNVSRTCRMRKKSLQETSSGTFSARIFSCLSVLLISNHTVFLVQFEINLHLWVFQKAEIALAEAFRAISAFWKTHSCKLIPNWSRTVWLPILTLECDSTLKGHCHAIWQLQKKIGVFASIEFQNYRPGFVNLMLRVENFLKKFAMVTLSDKGAFDIFVVALQKHYVHD